MNIINCTPHPITIVRPDNTNIVIPPSGINIRVNSKQDVIGNINGIPVVKTVFTGIDNLPAPQPDTVFIVSTLVLTAVQNTGIQRADLISPDTNTALRNPQGQIIGVTRFQTL